MDVINWISTKILQRIATIIGTSIVANVERAALHSHINEIEKTEEKAKALEASGNLRLAEYLRSQSAHLSLSDAGGQVQALAKNLAQPLGLPFEDGEQQRIATPQSSGSGSETPKKKRGRPKKSNTAEAENPVPAQEDQK